MISYDLNKSGKDYEGVFQAIKDASAGVWCHYLDSTWLIKSNYTSANDVFNKIKPHIDADDRCLVIEVTKNYQGWFSEKQWKYINEEIFS
jgi:hypothetical protein